MKGFFVVGDFSYLAQEGHLRCEMAIETSSKLRFFYAQLEGCKVKLHDEFGIVTGIDSIATQTLFSH
jgi:hypothetical protein